MYNIGIGAIIINNKYVKVFDVKIEITSKQVCSSWHTEK